MNRATNHEKVAGLASAATAVAATTKGNIADRDFDEESASDELFALSPRNPFAPNVSSDTCPNLRRHPTLPSKGNDVEHAAKGLVGVRTPPRRRRSERLGGDRNARERTRALQAATAAIEQRLSWWCEQIFFFSGFNSEFFFFWRKRREMRWEAKECGCLFGIIT